MIKEKTLGLIGAGRWGKNLARNFYNLGCLHTLCDANEKLLDSFQDQFEGVHFTGNYLAMLQNPVIDKVAIAAPAIAHFKLAKEALLHGKDVFVEKPLCMNVEEGEELIRIAEEKGAILMVGHILHYHGAVEKLKNLVISGALGKLQYIVSNRLNLGAFRTEENALWNFAPHDISVILALAGRLPLDVRCTGGAYISKGVADTTLTQLSFEGDLKAHIHVSWLHPFKEQKLTVIGSAGMAVFDDTKPWNEKLRVFKNHVRWTQGSIPEANGCDVENILLEEEEPLKNECLHFLQACATRKIPKTDGYEGLNVLKVLESAQKSLESGGELFYPDKMTSSIHETAVVDPRAFIGNNTKVWHFSHIMSGALIGDHCSIGQNVVISPQVRVGTGVKIQNNVSLYTGVVIEDDVFIGPSAVFTNVTNPRSAISRKHEFKATNVGKGATIGANSTILCGNNIGSYAFIGAGAVVTKDVPPFALVVGNPARQTGWMSKSGYKLDMPVHSNEVVIAKCPATNEEYQLEGSTLTPVELMAIHG